jgi:hypothetical protein
MIILAKPKKNPNNLSIVPKLPVFIIFDKKLKIIDNKTNINIKIDPPAIKSRIAESLKNLDNIILVFSKEIKATKEAKSHFDVDNNSLIKPRDNPNKDDIRVNEIIIMSKIAIY